MQYYDKHTGYIEEFHASDAFLTQLYKLQKRYGLYNERPPMSPSHPQKYNGDITGYSMRQCVKCGGVFN